MSPVPIVHIALGTPHSDVARDVLHAEFHDKLDLVTGPVERAHLRIVRMEELPEHPDAPLMAVGELTLTEMIAAMHDRPWLNHFVSARMIESAELGLTLPAAVWRIVVQRRLTRATHLGRQFAGRQATIRDSNQRETRVNAIAELASSMGATSALVERVRDTADELITNALYDAPAERRGVPAERQSRVLLEKEEACTITYGQAGKLFLIRVCDQFGSLRRDRMLEVLTRCSSSQSVGIDSSRGGAGLGMWRIFNHASFLVVNVVENVKTEIVVGINTGRGRRANPARAYHFFFDGDEENHDAQEVIQ